MTPQSDFCPPNEHIHNYYFYWDDEPVCMNCGYVKGSRFAHDVLITIVEEYRASLEQLSQE